VLPEGEDYLGPGRNNKWNLMPRRLRLLIALATLHTALLITSTVAGAKLVALPFGLAASATVLSYTLTFLILDTIAEIHGGAASRFVVNMGLVGMMLAALYLELAARLPAPAAFREAEAFATVLSSSWRIWFAGWLAYLASQHLDVRTYLLLKRTGAVGSAVVTRAGVSLALGQLVDTSIFVFVAFVGTEPLLPIIAGQYLIKVALAGVSLPLVSLVVAAARRLIEHEDVVGSRILSETALDAGDTRPRVDPG
jgi:uncharacterized integral membrane protein (TIGR00697 family)